MQIKLCAKCLTPSTSFTALSGRYMLFMSRKIRYSEMMWYYPPYTSPRIP